MSVNMNGLLRRMARRYEDDPTEPPARGNIPPVEDRGYSNPDLQLLPTEPLEPPLEYPPDEGGYRIYPSDSSPLAPGPYESGLEYDNYDDEAILEWERGVIERGNEIRDTALGTFEVQAGTNNILSRPPSPYPLN